MTCSRIGRATYCCGYAQHDGVPPRLDGPFSQITTSAPTCCSFALWVACSFLGKPRRPPSSRHHTSGGRKPAALTKLDFKRAGTKHDRLLFGRRVVVKAASGDHCTRDLRPVTSLGTATVSPEPVWSFRSRMPRVSATASS